MIYKNIVHTTGIGDFLAIDAYFNDLEKSKIENIFFINDISKQKNIKNIIKKSKKYNPNINFINLDSHYLDYWDDRRNIIHKNKINLKNTLVDFEFIWGTSEYKETRNLKNYFFAKENLTKIEKFNLPEKFCVLVTYTNPERLFDKRDWIQAMKILNFLKIKGIILGQKDKLNLKNKNIINLNKKTSIVEAIEITKKCSFYLGIDSFLSIVASSHLKNDKIQIKTKINNATENFSFYYPCQKNINIIRNNINFKYFIRNFYKLL